jgi:hypothetical protein
MTAADVYYSPSKRGRDAQTSGPSAQDRTGVPCSSDDIALTLAAAARALRDAMKDKSYQLTPLGMYAAGYLRHKRKQLTKGSQRKYESTLHKLALHFADLEPPDFEPPMGTTRVEDPGLDPANPHKPPAPAKQPGNRKPPNGRKRKPHNTETTAAI